MAPIDSYIICTSLRSGSASLCSLLPQVTDARRPGSWFHAPSLAGWRTWFDHQSLTRLRLTYDAVPDDPQATLAQGHSSRDLDADAADQVSTPVARLSDDMNCDWIDQWHHGS